MGGGGSCVLLYWMGLGLELRIMGMLGATQFRGRACWLRLGRTELLTSPAELPMGRMGFAQD